MIAKILRFFFAECLRIEKAECQGNRRAADMHQRIHDAAQKAYYPQIAEVRREMRDGDRVPIGGKDLRG